jgi:hypothetical protein
MDLNEQTDAFRFEIDSIVDRYCHEFDINAITMIGALQEKVYELCERGNIVFEMDSDFWEHRFGEDEADEDDDWFKL